MKTKDQARTEISELEQKLEKSKQSEEFLKNKIRELEQTNDDFERNERFLFFFKIVTNETKIIKKNKT